MQTLRYDNLGYAENHIVKMAHSSQKFAHQILWNMNANIYTRYVDENNFVEDVLRPTLEKLRQKIVGQLSGSDLQFYEREFKFFDKVTGISGALKPFIKRSKLEKKQKIDEELAQVVVDPGVYLPSNPDCVVVDIDYQSGRPLQSHAKAPFMATFKIRRGAPAALMLNRKQSSYESMFMLDGPAEVFESEEEDLE